MNSSRQLNDLINNVSKKSGVNAQILQKRYFIERFLERVSASDYRGKFILKGGVLISALVGLAARSTMDIDITIKHFSLSEESVKRAIAEITAIELDDNVKFDLRKMENIHEEADYDCYRISLDIVFDKVRDSIKIDITAGDVITPQEIQFGYETMLDKRKIALYSYNIETVMAEKIETILVRGVLNTRMRDFYDCFILDKIYCDSINIKTFCDALKATVARRQSEIIIAKSAKIIEELKANTELRKLWKAYIGSFQYAKEIALDETVGTVEKYITVFLKQTDSSPETNP